MLDNSELLRRSQDIRVEVVTPQTGTEPAKHAQHGSLFFSLPIPPHLPLVPKTCYDIHYVLLVSLCNFIRDAHAMPLPRAKPMVTTRGRCPPVCLLKAVVVSMQQQRAVMMFIYYLTGGHANVSDTC